jgi:hypothetical protein
MFWGNACPEYKIKKEYRYEENSVSGSVGSQTTIQITNEGEIPVSPTIRFLGISDDSAVGAWHFDENAGNITSDETGVNNGTLEPNETDGPQWTTDCKYDSCLSFDGVDDYVEVPHNDSLNFGTGDFTLSGWIKTTDTDILIVKHPAGWSNYYWLGLSWYKVAGGCGNDTNYLEINSDKGVADDIWHHLILVRDGDTLMLYADGVQVKSQTKTGLGNVSNDANLIIGGDPVENCCYLNGTIDEVVIFNRSLSQEEIQHLNSTKYKYGPRTSNPSVTGAGSSITFNGNVNMSQSVIIYGSGFSPNGTVTGIVPTLKPGSTTMTIGADAGSFDYEIRWYEFWEK